MTIGTKGMPRLAVFMRGVARRRAWRSILLFFAATAYEATELAVRVQCSYVEPQGWHESLQMRLVWFELLKEAALQCYTCPGSHEPCEEELQCR